MSRKKNQKATQITQIKVSGGEVKLKNPNKRKKILIITGSVLLGIIAVLAIIGGIVYSPAKNTYKQAIAGKEKFELAQEQITAQDFNGAIQSLNEAGENFDASKESFDKIAWLKFTPYFGKQLKAVDSLLIAAINISDALDNIMDIGVEIFAVLETDGDSSFKSITEKQKAEILKKLYESPPDIQGAKAELDLAVMQIEQIPEEGLMGPIASAVAPIKEKLPMVKQIIEKGIPLIEIVPAIAGYPDEKTYLFLLQNNDELRPTGGFIGTYGILKVKNGEIQSFFTDNIYVIDDQAKPTLFVDPPDAFKKYIGSSQWFMRDANWSPDYPTTAEKVEEFYHLEGGEEENIDGVIAVTPVFIESLLKMTGPIEVDGIEFNSENFVDKLQYEVEFGFAEDGVSELARKDIIGRMSSILMDRVTNLPKNQWGELWEIFAQNVDEKQILLYIKDDEVQEKITDMNWDGSVKETVDDYVMVIDANLAALKTDKVMERNIDYNVYEEDGQLYGDLNVHYKNNGTFTKFTTRYRTYTRVYVPLGSELVESSGIYNNDKTVGGKPADPETFEEFDKTVFGGFISVEPAEEHTVHYKYKLPQSVQDQINSGSYYLYAQKQAGTLGHGFNFSFDVGQGIKDYKPLDLGEKNGNNEVHFNTNLTIDREFLINL
ncbi:DUF4012 domain-containing protein [Patescibacteria group bacterium]|nr:DUF4012 domain-containing protein [Patescibacteria group bacterium]